MKNSRKTVNRIYHKKLQNGIVQRLLPAVQNKTVVVTSQTSLVLK